MQHWVTFFPCSQFAKARYQKKLLLLVGLCTCPYELPQQAWVDDVTQWPRVEFPDIVLYLIDTPGEFTCEKLKAYKSLEAYNYVSRWVGTYHIHMLLKAEVRPSQRVNSASHQPWVAVRRRSGCTSAAHCMCMKAHNITGVQKAQTCIHFLTRRSLFTCYCLAFQSWSMCATWLHKSSMHINALWMEPSIL